MRLGYAILADAAEVSPNGKISILGGEISTLALPQFPMLYARLSFVAKLQLEPDDYGRDHTFRLELVEPEEKRVVVGEPVPFNVPLGEDAPQNALIAGNIPPLLFRMPGTYELQLFTDDQLVASLPLLVQEQPTSQGSG
jgi:hypothetical protein